MLIIHLYSPVVISYDLYCVIGIIDSQIAKYQLCSKIDLADTRQFYVPVSLIFC